MIEMKNVAYLGLGSNIGNRIKNIFYALSFLRDNSFISINDISSFYETSPVGYKQKYFYNAVIKVYVNIEPHDLLLYVKQIEYTLGRKKKLRWGPRIIDIDILFFGNRIINDINLTIPHKEIENRLFVLIPLNEISSNFVHPILNKKISDILINRLQILRYQNQKIKTVINKLRIIKKLV
ncbi:MAG: 2-amino-4-hydroxy-6-hydroxymethyldihydropteridine diphosphokinase [Endomicrobium sp.]|jgi:2-amino-4-hydroxy-6-hydroxymethyldihydropteridine diphosphokinase|nr:2-amino-4-hydroxy-6-hydroxymethyldihydropteridine diphosphokinase [Endomicrobium sp.]